MVVILAVLTLSSNLTLVGFARPSVLQTEGCPTYETLLVVDLVDASPRSASVGTFVVTNVHVVTPDGTPVDLTPRTVSFLWSGPTGQKEYDSVPVALAPGQAGLYIYNQTVTDDLVKAVGEGTVTISVVACSCGDGLGNFGPPGLISSNRTLTPSDDSSVMIGPQTTTTTQGPQPVTYAVPLAIALLIIIGLVLLLIRRRRGQPQQQTTSTSQT
jgi:hypothetical protein